MSWVLNMSRLEFTPPAMEKYTLGPLGTVSNIARPCILTKELVIGIPEYRNVKRVETRNEDN